MTPPEGPPGQGGKRQSEVYIALSLATIYDLALAHRHVQDTRERLASSMIVTGADLMALDQVESTLDAIGKGVTTYRKAVRDGSRYGPKRTEGPKAAEGLGAEPGDRDGAERRGS